MKKAFYAVSVLFILFGLSLAAGAQTGPSSSKQPPPLKIIRLKDGSLLKGRIVDVHNGYYTIQTLVTGPIEVAESDVVSITADRPKSLPSNTGGQAKNFSTSTASAQMAPSQQIQDMQQKVLADPGIQGELQALTMDPEIMELLGNKNLLDAVFSQDPVRMQNDPNLQKLLQNPKIQQLMERIAQKLFGASSNGSFGTSASED